MFNHILYNLKRFKMCLKKNKQNEMSESYSELV